MGGVVTTAQPSATGPVRVLRPVRIRQLSAGLAVGAAVAALLSIALSSSTVRYFSDGEEYQSYVQTGTGVAISGGGGASIAWVGPTIVAAVLLALAALAALLAARTDLAGPWGAAAQQAALAATGILAVLTAVVVVDGASVVSQYGEGVVTRWGPAPVALGLAALLALAAGLAARRGRATVLATIGAEDTP